MQKYCAQMTFLELKSVISADLHNNLDKKDIHVSAIQLSRIKLVFC